MARLRDTPLLILLMALAGAAMLLPAGHAAILRDHALARAFLYAAMMVAVLCVMLALALAGRRFRPTARGQLATVAAVYLVLPPLLALPLLPDEGGGLRFGDAWFEMLSALTTTGATLYAPDDLTATVHLWRAFVGWLGGFYSLVVALAVLAPLNLGGMEVVSGRTPGRSQGGVQIVEVAGIRQRMARFALQLLPAYGGLTLLLWLLLIFAGDASLVALCHAMSTLATSGISPVGGLQGGQAGLAGEGLVALFLLFALSRRLLSLGQGQGSRPLTRDAELRTAAVILALVVGLLLMRQWAAAWRLGQGEDLGAALGALWGNLFMALSFLTTSGFES
ncbi:MAG: TrkH family potassium uptake protein, partial [Rhodobacteraceae bacterium]|nr:TrkH family potassium uptake protein [Paracoccaceae bacterium]